MNDECKKIILENIINELNEIDYILFYIEIKNNINSIYGKEIGKIRNKLDGLLSNLNELIVMNKWNDFFEGDDEK